MATQVVQMPSVLSLIFPIEETGLPASTNEANCPEALSNSVKKLCRSRSTYERNLKADVIHFARELQPNGVVDIVDLACSLSNLGHEVKVRYAEGGGPNCFKNLYHEFLLVKGKGDSAGSEIVVECAFSDHFLIPCATPAYNVLFNTLPTVFVGTVHQMAPLVELISHEMARSFTEMGVTMPPWRASRAIMSKWAPQRATDKLPSEAASPRGASFSSSELDKPVLAQKVDTGAMHPIAEPEHADRRGTTGGLPPCPQPNGTNKSKHPHSGVKAVSEVGSLPRVQTKVAGERSSSVRGPHISRHLHRSSGGSPVLSVKVGFDFPGRRSEK